MLVSLLLAGCSDPPMERLPALCEVQLTDVGALTIPVEFRAGIDQGPFPSGWREVAAGTAAMVIKDNAPGKGGNRPVWVGLVDLAKQDVWKMHVARRYLRQTGPAPAPGYYHFE